MKAQAVVFTDKLKVELQEVDVPELGPNQVEIAVDFSWISVGTESSFLRKERIRGELVYQEGDPSPFPRVPGYQKTGRICRVGKDVTKFKEGELVFATVSKVEQMVDNFGGHVSPAITDTRQVWKLPEGSDPLAYCGLVLTQVGYNCGQRPPLKPDSVGVVIGDGLVGQWAAQTLLHRGAHVILLGRHDERLAHLDPKISKINTKKVTLMEVMEPYKGQIHAVIDTVGSMNTFYQLQPLMKRDSHLVSAGFLGQTGFVDIQGLREQEITLHCPSGWTEERMNETLKGIQEGWLQTIPLITHRFPYAQAVEAWNMIINRSESYMGVILEW